MLSTKPDSKGGDMVKAWRKFFGVSVVLVVTLAFGGPGHAQSTPGTITPLQIEPDPSGLDLLNGQVEIGGPSISIPAAPRLSYSRGSDWYLNMSGEDKPNGTPDDGAPTASYQISYGGMKSISFACVYGMCRDSRDRQINQSASAFNTADFSLYLEGSQARYIYNVQAFDQTYNGQSYGERVVDYYASQIIYPDGETLTLSYNSHAVSSTFTAQRPWRITTTNGYFLELLYESNVYGAAGWFNVSSATIYKSDAPGTPLVRLTYSAGGAEVTDLLGRTWTCQPDCGNAIGAKPWRASGSSRLPGTSAEQRVASSANLMVTTALTADGVAWNYSYGGFQSNPYTGAYTYTTVNVTGPEGFARTYNIQIAQSPEPQDVRPGQEVYLYNKAVSGWADSQGRTTATGIDGKGRITSITQPEGNGVAIIYDYRGNVIQKRTFAKPGSGLADLFETANYDAGGGLVAVRPNWTRDAKGNQTDYTWGTHLGLLTQLDPADQNGQRRKLKISYDSQNRPIREEICAANSAGAELTCGTANSFVKQTTYWGNTRLPATTTATDGVGNAPLTTSYSYDPAGRLLSMDPPLAGSEDAVYYRYDVAGRKTWEIGAYNNTSGKRQVTRTTYRNEDDQVSKVENGYIGADPNDTNFVLLRETRTTYNDRRLPVTTSLVSGTTTYGLSQTSYDTRNRKSCTATRMNPAAWGALPASACTLGTQGSDGPDRITRTVYDADSQVLQLRKAVGTPIEIADVTYSYSNNGKPRFAIDANGNRAEMRYDGHDRQVAWMFPSTTRPSAYNPGTQASALASAGAINEYDYEGYTWDANGNRATLRKRDGSVLSYTYDALNRVTLKVVPERAGLAATHTRDVYSGYDIRGLQTYARFDSTTGEGVTTAYDIYGRKNAETLLMDGVSRTVSSGLNENGARVILYHPDGNYVYYNRNAQGGLYFADSSSGPLFYSPYNPDGSVDVLYRWRSGVGWYHYTDYSYDGVQRLSAFTSAFANGSYNTTSTFTRNAASQIASVTRSNDAYAWTGAVNVNRSYTANGLNQYSAVAGTAFAHDANGNLTSDGTNSYLYDIENRLVSRSGGGSASLRYDPLGRLYEVTGASGTTRFLYDGDALVAEYNAAGSLLRRYVHGASDGTDDPLVWFEGASVADSARRYLFSDERGSIVAISDGNGNKLAINAYDEYGIPDDGSQGSLATKGRFRYTGQTLIPELGMYYYKARMYSPTLGRFMQTDPIGYKDQINLYAYVANDPVNKVDPDGQESADLSLRGIAAIEADEREHPGDPAARKAVVLTTAAAVSCVFGCRLVPAAIRSIRDAVFGKTVSAEARAAITQRVAGLERNAKNYEAQAARHFRDAQSMRTSPTVKPGMEGQSAERIAAQQQRRIEILERDGNMFKQRAEELRREAEKLRSQM